MKYVHELIIDSEECKIRTYKGNEILHGDAEIVVDLYKRDRKWYIYCSRFQNEFGPVTITAKTKSGQLSQALKYIADEMTAKAKLINKMAKFVIASK